jgi:hypothetical protein
MAISIDAGRNTIKYISERPPFSRRMGFFRLRMKVETAILVLILSMAMLAMAERCLYAGDVPNSEEIGKEIFDDISTEYVTCAAFYFFCSETLRRSGDGETASRYKKISGSALEFALIAAKKDRDQELAEKVTKARLDLEMNAMLNQIDKDIGNISILMNTYHDRCNEIMTDPAKIVD